MDPLWLTIAFLLGFLARQVGLPPLVGFLVGGFALGAFGVVPGSTLDQLADVGVKLLLFGIGLKVRIKSLASREILGGGGIHLILTVVSFCFLLYLLSVLGLPLLSGGDLSQLLLLAFALSFSSTVFAVKVLEERGEFKSFHGRVSIGILILQDIFAVGFLALSEGNIPSVWALLVLAGLLISRPLLFRILDRIGHGELVALFGLSLVIVTAFLFSQVGLKGDLGALLVGFLLAGHQKGGELGESLLGLKDLLLVGFFLTIGISGEPTLELLGLGVMLALLVPVKSALYILVLTRFRLRSRTAFLASLALSNYSEFGLIVGALAVSAGMLPNEWLTIVAIALSITFLFASVLNGRPHTLYARVSPFVCKLETEKRHPEDELIDPGDVDVLIFGMGRVGSGAYKEMERRYKGPIVGIDFDQKTVEKNRLEGKNVIVGDAEDPDFWNRITPERKRAVKLVLLALPDHSANLRTLKRLEESPYQGPVVATARFKDEIQELLDAGATAAYDFFSEAGAGFAEHVCERLDRDWC